MGKKFIFDKKIAIILSCLAVVAIIAAIAADINFTISPESLHTSQELGNIEPGVKTIKGTGVRGRFATASGKEVIILTEDLPARSLDAIYEISNDAENFAFAMDGIFYPDGQGGPPPEWSAQFGGSSISEFYLDPKNTAVGIGEELTIEAKSDMPGADTSSVWQTGDAVVVVGDVDNSDSLTLRWDSTGQKVISAQSIADNEKSDTAAVAVMELSKLQYKIASGSFTDFPKIGCVYLPKDTQIYFRAIFEPYNFEQWIAWSGFGVSGYGEETSAIYNEESDSVNFIYANVAGSEGGLTGGIKIVGSEEEANELNANRAIANIEPAAVEVGFERTKSIAPVMGADMSLFEFSAVDNSKLELTQAAGDSETVNLTFKALEKGAHEVKVVYDNEEFAPEAIDAFELTAFINGDNISELIEVDGKKYYGVKLEIEMSPYVAGVDFNVNAEVGASFDNSNLNGSVSSNLFNSDTGKWSGTVYVSTDLKGQKAFSIIPTQDESIIGDGVEAIAPETMSLLAPVVIAPVGGLFSMPTDVKFQEVKAANNYTIIIKQKENSEVIYTFENLMVGDQLVSVAGVLTYTVDMSEQLEKEVDYDITISASSNGLEDGNANDEFSYVDGRPVTITVTLNGEAAADQIVYASGRLDTEGNPLSAVTDENGQAQFVLTSEDATRFYVYYGEIQSFSPSITPPGNGTITLAIYNAYFDVRGTYSGGRIGGVQIRAYDYDTNDDLGIFRISRDRYYSHMYVPPEAGKKVKFKAFSNGIEKWTSNFFNLESSGSYFYRFSFDDQTVVSLMRGNRPLILDNLDDYYYSFPSFMDNYVCSFDRSDTKTGTFYYDLYYNYYSGQPNEVYAFPKFLTENKFTYKFNNENYETDYVVSPHLDGVTITVPEFSSLYVYSGDEYYYGVSPQANLPVKVVDESGIEISEEIVSDNSGYVLYMPHSPPEGKIKFTATVHKREFESELVDYNYDAKLKIADYSQVTVLKDGQPLEGIEVVNYGSNSNYEFERITTASDGKAMFWLDTNVDSGNQRYAHQRRFKVVYNGVDFWSGWVYGTQNTTINIVGDVTVQLKRGSANYRQYYSNYFERPVVKAYNEAGDLLASQTVSTSGSTKFGLVCDEKINFITEFAGQSYETGFVLTPQTQQTIQMPSLTRTFVYQGNPNESSAQARKLANFEITLCDANGNVLSDAVISDEDGIATFAVEENKTVKFKSEAGGFIHYSPSFTSNQDNPFAGKPNESKVTVNFNGTGFEDVLVKVFNNNDGSLLTEITTDENGQASALLPYYQNLTTSRNQIKFIAYYEGSEFESDLSYAPTNSTIEVNGDSIITVMRGDIPFAVNNSSFYVNSYSGETVRAQNTDSIVYNKSIDNNGQAIFRLDYNIPLTFYYDFEGTTYQTESVQTPYQGTIDLPEFSRVQVRDDSSLKRLMTYIPVFACDTDGNEVLEYPVYTDHLGISVLFPEGYETLKFKTVLNGIEFWSGSVAKNTDTKITVPEARKVTVDFDEGEYENVNDAEYDLELDSGWKINFSYSFTEYDPVITLTDENGNVISGSFEIDPDDENKYVSSNGYEITFGYESDEQGETASVVVANENGEAVGSLSEYYENPLLELDGGLKVYFHYEDGDEYARASIYDLEDNKIDELTVDAEDDSKYTSETGRALIFNDSEDGLKTTIIVTTEDGVTELDRLVIYNAATLDNGYRVQFYYDEEGDTSKAKIYNPSDELVADLTVNNEDEDIYENEVGYQLRFTENEEQTQITLTAYAPPENEGGEHVYLDSLTIEVEPYEGDGRDYYSNGHWYDFDPAKLELVDGEGNVVYEYEVSGDGEADIYIPDGYKLKYTNSQGEVFWKELSSSDNEIKLNAISVNVKVMRENEDGLSAVNDIEVFECLINNNETGISQQTDLSGATRFGINEGDERKYKVVYEGEEYYSSTTTGNEELIIILPPAVPLSVYEIYLRHDEYDGLAKSEILKVVGDNFGKQTPMQIVIGEQLQDAATNEIFAKSYNRPGQYIETLNIDLNNNGVYEDDELNINARIYSVAIDFNGPTALMKNYYFGTGYRNKNNVRVIGVDNSKVTFTDDSESSYYVSSSKVSSNRFKLNINAPYSGDLFIVAKLIGSSKVLAQQKVDLFDYWRKNTSTLYPKFNYSDGSRYYELWDGMWPHVPNLEKRLRVSGNNVMTENGTRQMSYSTNDMFLSDVRDDEYVGSYAFVILPPTGNSSAVHYIEFYQNGELIGSGDGDGFYDMYSLEDDEQLRQEKIANGTYDYTRRNPFPTSRYGGICNGCGKRHAISKNTCSICGQIIQGVGQGVITNDEGMSTIIKEAESLPSPVLSSNVSVAEKVDSNESNRNASLESATCPKCGQVHCQSCMSKCNGEGGMYRRDFNQVQTDGSN